MASDSDIFAKIRIPPRKGRKKSPEEVKSTQCAWEECERPGTHKAPMGRNREGQYLNFCIDHVREYNKNFNYFQGLSDDEIARFQKDAQTGHRPTWRMSARRPGEPVPESSVRGTPGWHAKVRSRLTVEGKRVQTPGGSAMERKLRRMEEKALRDLNLKPQASKDEINRRYKQLLRQTHPDMNGGDRSTEGRLQQVIAAHKVLKKAGLC